MISTSGAATATGRFKSAQAWQHTDPQYTGSSDLDTYGQWSEVPDYGWCWTPQVDAGWVPYSAGYWGYEPYWGWTWISAEPWGWAPYHYGRWFMYGGRLALVAGQGPLDSGDVVARLCLVLRVWRQGLWSRLRLRFWLDWLAGARSA